MKKYIFIDIDGTLLDHQTGIPESAIFAIQEARRNGNKVFICTGRAKSEVNINILNIGFDGYIFSAGAVVETEGKQLISRNLDTEDLDSMITCFKKEALGYVLEGHCKSYIDPIAEKYFSVFRENLKKVNRNLSPLFVNPDMVPIQNYDKETSLINKISLFSDSAEILKRIERSLKSGLRMITHKSSLGIINAEIFLKDISKASGIDVIMKYYSDSIDKTIGIGDSANDIEMIQYCNIGVSMGNGIEAVKKIADYITDTARENGIYNCFKKFELI